MILKTKIILGKIKVKLTRHEIEVLLAFIEAVVVEDNNSVYDIEYIHAAWLASLKEICVFLMDRNLEKPIHTVSLSESQYMALMELFKRNYPNESFCITGNGIYGKLHLLGINSNLIKSVDHVCSVPLLKPISQPLIDK